MDFLPKVKLDLIISDDLRDKIYILTVSTKVLDGKIFVMDVNQVIRIRTGEKGDAAV